MLIRSQDKRTLYNLENIANIFVDDKRICVHQTTVLNDVECIGTYSTEEKVIKVLDMIQEYYAECEAYKVLCNGEFEHVISTFFEMQKDDFLKIFKRNFVFQMPQDSEQVAEEYNNGWIPVSEGFPKDCTIHEVTVKFGNSMTYIEFAYYDEAKEEWWKHDDSRLVNVLAWKEHTDPYQAKGEQKNA